VTADTTLHEITEAFNVRFPFCIHFNENFSLLLSFLLQNVKNISSDQQDLGEYWR
jgi:hypothetical protein